MTAVDFREELEALLHRAGLPREQVAAAMGLADAHAKACARRAAAVKAAKDANPAARPATPAAVHWTLSPGRPACIPYDLTAGRGRELATDPGKVTCGHCRRKPAWRDASALAALEGYAAEGSS